MSTDYIVHLTHYRVFRISVTAKSCDAAETEAEQLWCSGDIDDFKLCDSGIEHIDAQEEVQP